MIEGGIFPFTPEQLSGMNGDLERVLVSQERFSYESLPDSLPSQGTDLYATWLGRLTHADPGERERAGASALIARTRILVYQAVPVIGERDYAPIGGVFYPNESTISSGDFHSHPDLSCFGEGDLRSMGWKPGRVDDPMVHLAGTRFRNYMIILTKQTPYENQDKVMQDSRQVNYDLYSDFPSVEDMIAERLGRPIEDEEYTRICESLAYDGNLHHYFKKFNLLISMAERYKWGAYYSNQDGLFVRLTPLNIVQHLVENVERAIDEVFPPTGVEDQLAIGAIE